MSKKSVCSFVAILFALHVLSACDEPPTSSSSDAGAQNLAADGGQNLVDSDAGDVNANLDAGTVNTEDVGIVQVDAGVSGSGNLDAGVANAASDAGTNNSNGEWDVVVPDLGSSIIYANTPPSTVTNTTCSTAQWWRTNDLFGNDRMVPGGNCIECHADRNEGPTYSLRVLFRQALTTETTAEEFLRLLLRLSMPTATLHLR